MCASVCLCVCMCVYLRSCSCRRCHRCYHRVRMHICGSFFSAQRLGLCTSTTIPPGAPLCQGLNDILFKSTGWVVEACDTRNRGQPEANAHPQGAPRQLEKRTHVFVAQTTAGKKQRSAFLNKGSNHVAPLLLLVLLHVARTLHVRCTYVARSVARNVARSENLSKTYISHERQKK